MPKKGILALDVDGTLTHRLDWIDPKVVEALQNYQDNGWEIVLITGRLFSFAWRILQFIPFPYLLSVQNGADILEMPEKTILQRNYLSASILPKVEEACKGVQEDFLIYTGIDEGGYCYFRKERFSEKTLEYLRVLEELGNSTWKPSDFVFEKGTEFPLIKCFGQKEEMSALHKRLQQILEIEVSMIRDPVDRSLYLNLITHPEANKGGVVRFLQSHLRPSVVIAAGDDRNDLKMLKQADIAIAVETAPQEVLDLADVFAKPAEELGILSALEEAIALASR